MSKTLYLNLNQITEITNKDVFLKDVATVYCDDATIADKCNALKIKSIKADRNHRYVMSVLDVIQKIQEMDGTIQVNSVGEVNFIIDYHVPKPPRHLWEWIKTMFVCCVCFAGASFAIMTFNNDVSVVEVFSEIYFIIMGYESNGFTILELSYSLGLGIGIILFFNHFAKFKVMTDPTPLEVEMRIYEDNASKTVIQNNGRKEKKVDVN